MFLNGASSSDDFSTFLRLSRGVQLSREIAEHDLDGKDPLPDYLGSTVIRFPRVRPSSVSSEDGYVRVGPQRKWRAADDAEEIKIELGVASSDRLSVTDSVEDAESGHTGQVQSNQTAIDESNVAPSVQEPDRDLRRARSSPMSSIETIT